MHSLEIACTRPAWAQVVEFESLGVRVRNTKRVFVLNPTNITYDFVWAPVGVSAAAAATGGRSGGGVVAAGAFVCTTRSGTIAGGM